MAWPKATPSFGLELVFSYWSTGAICPRSNEGWTSLRVPAWVLRFTQTRRWFQGECLFQPCLGGGATKRHVHVQFRDPAKAKECFPTWASAGPRFSPSSMHPQHILRIKRQHGSASNEGTTEMGGFPLNLCKGYPQPPSFVV